MMKITPTGALGARIEGIDLAKPLSAGDFARILQAVGRHSVVCFPGQTIDAGQQKAFAAQFGSLEVNVASRGFTVPDHPEVMVLSNIVENGRALGLGDAGQDWHTDMSYSQPIAFVKVNYALKVPVRDGRPLGDTEFLDMYRAYDDLSENLKAKIEGRTATHDFNKFWEMMRREKGSQRPPLTAAQRAAKPPVSHPVFMTHPITGKKVLYANPGYAVRLDQLPEAESEEVLNFLFAHQLRPEFRYANQWEEHDVLMWDNMGTIHNAVADYTPQEPRLIKRFQVMADLFFHADGSAKPLMELPSLDAAYA